VKKKLATIMECLRPAGIVLGYFFADYFGDDAISKFHILGPVVVIVMSGTVAFEAFVLGEAASEKIGYKSDRAYQIQSGLNHVALSVTALLVFFVAWGRYADATIVTAMLLFFVFSSVNHAATAIREHNLKPVNLMRPILTLILLAVLLPPMIKALAQ
jgi:hypothetical protein